jgi:hypothetical protein
MCSGEQDTDTRIFGPNVGSACKLRNLRPFMILHCGELTSNAREVSCVTYCFYLLVAGMELNTDTRIFSPLPGVPGVYQPTTYSVLPTPSQTYQGTTPAHSI